MSESVKKLAKSNVIFLEDVPKVQPGKAQKSAEISVFSEQTHNAPKKKEVSAYPLVENGSFALKKLCQQDTESLSATELRKKYKGEANSHRNMKSRCKKGQGTLHPEFEKFKDFLGLLGPKPDASFTLDRIDHNNPEYSAANTRWASKALQTANRKSTRHLTDDAGSCHSLAEWCRRTDLKQSTIRQRLKRGWSENKAVTLPVGSKKGGTSVSPRRYGAERSRSVYAEAWQRSLRKIHEQPFVTLSKKDDAMLQNIVEKLRYNGINPLQFIDFLQNHWARFTQYAEVQYGAFNSPHVPTISYLLLNINAAGNFYLDLTKEAERNQGQATRTARAQQEQGEFIEQFMCRDPEYKEVWEALCALRARGPLPHFGVTPSEMMAFEYDRQYYPGSTRDVYEDLLESLEMKEFDLRRSKGLLEKAMQAWLNKSRDA